MTNNNLSPFVLIRHGGQTPGQRPRSCVAEIVVKGSDNCDSIWVETPHGRNFKKISYRHDVLYHFPKKECNDEKGPTPGNVRAAKRRLSREQTQ